MKITDAEKKEIIKNILGAADRKKQLGIEADLHCITKGDVKDILKADGVDLRIFCGGRHDKKRIEDELIKEQAQEPVDEPTTTEQAESDEELAQQWADLAIPPYEPLPPLSNEERVREPIPYTKPEILDGPPQDSPRIVKDIPCEAAIIIGPHIIEDEQLMSAVNKKLKELAAERQAHAERIEVIDNTLRKYAYFCTDCSNLIESEGIEV
ncbi:MAG: hypothetical protein IKH96_04740 [Ruminococcus sp.]|uniref:hypothetical protein n=1 Tax=Ruminococcus sp. TaxID=41978 RepID=UPI0025F8B5B8|nr:hypothetical protein [Ruminococcus sp.]MBR6995310.1 hypothetical protein [Ruminococcus sp.]